MKLLFILLLGLGFGQSQEPDWWFNPGCDNDYHCAKYTGYSLAGTLLGALSYFSGDGDMYMNRIIGRENDSYTDNYKNILESISDFEIGNINIENLTTRIIEESGLGDESSYSDTFKNTSSLTAIINDESNQAISIQRTIQESGLGNESEYQDHINVSLLNCSIMDLINELKLNGAIIKWDVVDFRYYILLSIPSTSFE